MNIVKGVADLIRRTSGTQPGESGGPWPQSERFSVPSPRICFSEVGDDAILNTLWKRHVNANDKEEKRRVFLIFLEQFLLVYENWEPVYSGHLAEAGSSTSAILDSSSGFHDTVVGCSAGHPAEMILVLTQEIAQLTSHVIELNSSIAQYTKDPLGASLSFNIVTEGVLVLEVLTIITRSIHNCRIFGYYGGIQKLTALMKAAVVQLKAFTGALAVDENLTSLQVEKSKVLQKILLCVVSVTCTFINLKLNVDKRAKLFTTTGEFSLPSEESCFTDLSGGTCGSFSESRVHWHQKAIVSVMEAGGLNWLVELLRVIRRLSMKEQWTDISLQYLTLSTLQSALSENPRAQNHFRSIGGLEVLLDGLGFSSNSALALKNISNADNERIENPFLAIIQLQVLSLEVLREAVFGSLSNLQFLCEIGRVHKFANSICSPAFMLQEIQQQRVDSVLNSDLRAPNSVSETDVNVRTPIMESPYSFNDDSCPQYWKDYAVKLSRVLCSFLLGLEDIKLHHVQASSVGRSAVPVSSLYWELSIKWIMKVLLTMFPCIKACSNQNELPNHLRIFVNTLQHYILYAFRKVLISLPTLLEVFREEGIWDVTFSENFFYFGPNSEEFSGNLSPFVEGDPNKLEHPSLNSTDNQTKASEVEILQMEIISFVEFAATSSGTKHNLPECSVLLEALEQSACIPELASALAKSLHRILQLTVEQTIASFKTLDAISRVLKVACVQACEFKRPENFGSSDVIEPAKATSSSEVYRTWLKSMDATLELYTAFLSMAEDAKTLVLHTPSCIDCLFDLFWEKGLRKLVVSHILDLMKLPPSSEEDQMAKLRLCSKYLETFTSIKEREKDFAELATDLLNGVKDMLLSNQLYYQALFRDGECFLHIVSLLNGNLEEEKGEQLVLNVLQTLTCLVKSNDASKGAFRALVGQGYQTLQSLLLDFCQWRPSKGLLNALLDMLVDGNFDIKANSVIKNEDVIVLFLSVLQKSSNSLQHYGLDVLQQLLRDSISNRASCVRAGMLNFLLDWFSQEELEQVILKIAHLIQVIGGHSISGKDIHKVFALLRDDKIGSKQQNCSLLLTSIKSMLNEKGPTAFFDLNGNDSGIVVKTPLQWPLNKGFSFSCWVRVESFPKTGTVGLFSFLTEHGRGCFAVLGKDKLVYESFNQKRQGVSLPLSLVTKKWHFLCITHSIGRAFSGGSQLRVYVDGVLVSSEKCRYAKVTDSVTHCTIGTRITPALCDEEKSLVFVEDSSHFLGQIGPVYMFSDAISPEQILGIYSLGPSYMYSFLDNEVALASDNPLPNGLLDAKDGLASKIIFGLNAQASDGKTLFNVSPMQDHALEKSSFQASVMDGTQLCSRRLLQQIIYCVGGVSVFFPLLTQFDRMETSETGQLGDTLLRSVMRDCLTAEVIELIASVLDENLANQQQMHLLSGFSILGFLLQSVPPLKLNLETLGALRRLYNVVANCGMSELLVKDAISSIFLNPFIWVYATYKVQLELYMFLIQQFDSDPRFLTGLCQLPRVIDILRQFYWDKARSRATYGSKPLLHPITEEVIGVRPCQEDIRKIRLLLLSLGEMSLRQNIAASDIKSLIAFFAASEDIACIEDVLHMIIRAVCQKLLLASFLEQVNLLGGCHIFVDLLRRDFEPVRLLALNFLGRLLVGLPAEKKGPRFFNLAVGRSRSLSESPRKIDIRLQPIFSAISDRLFAFPLTDLLCASLFDALLGGASPKQVLQKYSQSEKHRSKSSQFILPQMLVLIFRFLSTCEEVALRLKMFRDLLDLLDSNPSNIEALMEYGWNSWLATSVSRIDMFMKYKAELQDPPDDIMTEHTLARNLFRVVLSHYVHSVKGGWHQIEETLNFLLVHFDQDDLVRRKFLLDIFGDLTGKLVELSSEDIILVSQPSRDNTLYLLSLIDEMLVFDLEIKLPYPGSSSDFPVDCLELESHKDLTTPLLESVYGDAGGQALRDPTASLQAMNAVDTISDDCWDLFDKLWIIIGHIYGKGPNKMLPKSSSSVGPSFGQRARGLVESLNIPAAEMAAVVVSGSIGNALGGKPNKTVDKAMLLRGEKCPRIVFRLVILYLCKACIERASKCVQLVVSLLPCFLPFDDEQSKSKLQHFIWSLLTARLHYGRLDDGARFHVISHLIRETVNCGKSMLATGIMGKDDPSDSGSNTKEAGTIHALIQQDRVLAVVTEETKYIKNSKEDRVKQLQELRIRLEESSAAESNHKKVFEDEIESSLSFIVASDDGRRAAFQLAHDEDQQIAAEKWIHMFRTLIDERGPWSANPFPNNIATHWKLDKTEDTWRRRPKLRRNYCFEEKLCNPPSLIPSSEASQTSDHKTGFASHIPDQMKRILLKGVRRITDEGSSESETTESMGPQASVPEDPSENFPEPLKDNIVQKDGGQDRKESTSCPPDADASEVLMSIFCVLVTPKRKIAGHLAVMRNFLHFFGEFLVEGTGGASVFSSICVSTNSDSTKADHQGVQKEKFPRWPFNLDLDHEKGQNGNIGEGSNKKQPKKIKRHRRWKVSKIKSVHWTRYLLRYTAIEIFFNDSLSPIFFNFASHKDAKDVGMFIVSSRNESLFPKGTYRDRSCAISFVDRRLALEMAEIAQESWRRRDMTNFEYLMILNTLAGRSYNDLTQYPIFPWVLADYSSEKLDFNKSSTFRDLSKPVGALDLKRFEVFEDRYRSFTDPDIPSFYYGSHYSSMGIVLFYLLRLEPFTALHRNLQGGKLDHADRLFQSIESTYKNCLTNTSDVKELIPEFFYMPEFLVNSNSYHLGVKQDGEPLGDVCLPPWAKGSPEEFMQKNREALESEYVSSNLHQWIDLIFGYKQRGKPAVEAANIFYYLTYEGAVDLEQMEDELQRSAIEDQIANFGQTPIQIFRIRHPRRGPPIPIAHPLYFAPRSISLTSIITNVTNPPSPVLYIGMLDSNIILVNQGLTMSVKMWLTTQLQAGGNFTFSGSQEPFFGIGSDILSPRKIGSSLAENVVLGSQCFATMQTPSENFLISGGNWENSFQVISINDGRVVQSIRQHKDVVSCIAVTSDGSILATGSYDTTVMVWEVSKVKSIEKKVRPTQTEMPRKDYVIVESPFHILCGHDDIITCLFVSIELDIVISGSKDGTCVFHTLREGRYIRSLRHPSGCALTKLVASQHGRIVFYAEDDLSLNMYSINGKHIASSESNGRLNCVELSSCGEFLVCAGDQGQIVVRSMSSLDVVRRYDGVGKIITALRVTQEECFLAGTKDGTLLVYSIEHPQLRKTSIPRNMRGKASAT